MAISLMRWRPDTCRCVIIQTHDPADPSVEISLSRVEQKCPAHAALTDAEVWEAVWSYPTGENRRKNLVLRHIAERFGQAASEATGWNFSGEGKARTLDVLTPRGVPIADVDTFARATFGDGKTRIEEARVENGGGGRLA